MTNTMKSEKIPLKFKKKELDAVFSMKNSSQKMHHKNSINDIGQKQKHEEQHPKTKSIIEFEPSLLVE